VGKAAPVVNAGPPSVCCLYGGPAIGEPRADSPAGVIRRFRLADADVVSALICNTLLVSNGADYEIEVVNNLARGFSPQALRSLSQRRQIWVYEEEGRVTATIALEDGTISGFFVAPDRQRGGVGRCLLRYVEDRARRQGLHSLRLSASLTAVPFYTRLGYVPFGEECDNEDTGRVIPMRKAL
jgi:GNAT superfamily N-acetyltransferase